MINNYHINKIINLVGGINDEHSIRISKGNKG